MINTSMHSHPSAFQRLQNMANLQRPLPPPTPELSFSSPDMAQLGGEYALGDSIIVPAQDISAHAAFHANMAQGPAQPVDDGSISDILKDVFAAFDSDKDGSVSAKEMETGIANLQKMESEGVVYGLSSPAAGDDMDAIIGEAVTQPVPGEADGNIDGEIMSVFGKAVDLGDILFDTEEAILVGTGADAAEVDKPVTDTQSAPDLQTPAAGDKGTFNAAAFYQSLIAALSAAADKAGQTSPLNRAA